MDNKLKWKTEILKYLPVEIEKSINDLPTSELCNVSEIRLRVNGYSSITVKGENKVLYFDKKPIVLTTDDIRGVFEAICDNQVFKYENQIKNGYITIRGGHRVGFCGTAVYNDGELATITNISSIVFRISRQILNSAREIIGNVLIDNKIISTLIVSEPGGGKTTILTDLTRLLSNLGKRCAVIDERGEICSLFDSAAQKEIGKFTDVLNEYSKKDGMILALRCLSPQVIICDEVGSSDDVDGMLEAMNAGVPVIATAHASCEQELYERPQIERLIDHGGIDKILFLKSSANPGVIKKIITVNSYDEDYWNSDCSN